MVFIHHNSLLQSFNDTNPFQHHTTPGLPLLIIGALSLVAGAITILLPETAGGNLPQTLADGDLLGRGQGLFDTCQSPKPDPQAEGAGVKALPA